MDSSAKITAANSWVSRLLSWPVMAGMSLLLTMVWGGQFYWKYQREMLAAQKLKSLGFMLHSESYGPGWGPEVFQKLTIWDHVTVIGSCHLLRPAGNIENLNDFPKLEVLDLTETRVTDEDLAQLQGMKTLQSLILKDAGVTDAGLAHLRGLENLNHLDLGDTQITAAGLVHLKQFPQLCVLELSGLNLNDASLVQLQSLEKLTELNLELNTNVTDRGLVHLQKLKNLKTLWLERCSVTETGVQTLRTALPKLKVIWDQ